MMEAAILEVKAAEKKKNELEINQSLLSVGGDEPANMDNTSIDDCVEADTNSSHWAQLAIDESMVEPTDLVNCFTCDKFSCVHNQDSNVLIV